MSVEAELNQILVCLETLTKRLDAIDAKYETVNARINEVEEKFDAKLNEIEHQVKDKVCRNEFNHLENQFKKQIESVYEENLMKETYDKRLNSLIHGLEESETNAWETKDQTTKIFHDFLTKGLQIDPTSMNIIDIHRLPQRPIFVNKAKKNRAIIIKLSTAMERKRIFSSLKHLKKFNEERSASNSPSIYVTEHLPKEFQIPKKSLMPQFKEARKLNKTTYRRAVEGRYCLFVDNVKVAPLL